MEDNKNTENLDKKVQLSFTLKKSINDDFLNYCKDNLINKSQLLEKIVDDYLKINASK